MRATPMGRWGVPLLLATTRADVVFEVRPQPTCTRCMFWIREAFVPLVEAGFPGDQVKLTVVPWPGEDAVDKVNANGLFEGGDENTAVQVCAMRNALAQPAPIDSPAMVAAVKFIACDDTQRMGGAGLERVKACAAEAGLPLDGPEGVGECEDPEVGLALMRQAEYSKLVLDAKGQPYTSAPHVFLNGEVLNCPNHEYCESTGGERVAGEVGLSGATPLPRPGTLQEITCALIDDPKPAVCDGLEPVDDAAGPYTGPTTTACENCRLRRWEAVAGELDAAAARGVQHWPPSPAPLLGLAAFALLASAAALRVCGRHPRERAPQGDGLATEAELLAE